MRKQIGIENVVGERPTGRISFLFTCENKVQKTPDTNRILKKVAKAEVWRDGSRKAG